MLAANIFGSGAAGIIGFIMTFLILYFSEILPKTIGTYYWRKLLNWMIPVLVFCENNLSILFAISRDDEISCS